MEASIHLGDTTANPDIPCHPREADEPFSIAVLVTPGFSNLSLAAYLEPFRIANILSSRPLFAWQIISSDGRTVESASAITISADMSCREFSNAITAGHKVNQLTIISGEPVDQRLDSAIRAFLRTMARRKLGIAALGTATWLLAGSGLLGNTRCTIHWSRLAAFSELFPKPEVQDSLFVNDGQFSTCAGELAAFDLAIDLIGTRAGADLAQEVCRHATVAGQRSASRRQTGPMGLPSANASEKLIVALQLMEEHVERPLPLYRIAGLSGVSLRHLERLFAAQVHSSPGRHYVTIRAHRARRLVEGTRMAVLDIALACGFQTASHFAKCFRMVHGMSPQECRSRLPAWVGIGLG